MPSRGDCILKVRAMDNGLVDEIKAHSIEIKLKAVFQNSCYGFYNDKLITILPRQKALLPRSITVKDPWEIHNFTPGQILSLGYHHRDTLRVEETTKKITLSLKEEVYQDLFFKQGQIKRFLQSSKSFTLGIGKVFDLSFEKKDKDHIDFTNSMEQEINERILEIIFSLREEKEIQAKNIIGYGVGLTPSADDFLLGLFSLLEAKGQEKKRENLKKYSKSHLHGTTEVSQFMLTYAMEYYAYPQFLVDYLHKPGEENEDFKEFLAHGSTSGMDLLAGVYAGMQIISQEDL